MLKILVQLCCVVYNMCNWVAFAYIYIHIYIHSLPMHITLGQKRSQNKDICFFIHIATTIQTFVIAVINIQTGMSIN
jgi:hypothetical protein